MFVQREQGVLQWQCERIISKLNMNTMQSC
jgi:hypothetical protein